MLASLAKDDKVVHFSGFARKMNHLSSSLLQGKRVNKIISTF
ncbi:MAG: hypothetical protein U5L45_18150 [Saprospiraceae bacterium]|nr:hypothetical protein [Saprospiraceae bacterium]